MVVLMNTVQCCQLSDFLCDCSKLLILITLRSRKRVQTKRGKIPTEGPNIKGAKVASRDGHITSKPNRFLLRAGV